MLIHESRTQYRSGWFNFTNELSVSQKWIRSTLKRSPEVPVNYIMFLINVLLLIKLDRVIIFRECLNRVWKSKIVILADWRHLLFICWTMLNYIRTLVVNLESARSPINCELILTEVLLDGTNTVVRILLMFRQNEWITLASYYHTLLPGYSTGECFSSFEIYYLDLFIYM